MNNNVIGDDQSELSKLKNALHFYGTHKSNCKVWWMTTRAESITREKCTCGLEDILKSYEKTT